MNMEAKWGAIALIVLIIFVELKPVIKSWCNYINMKTEQLKSENNKK